MIKDFLRLFNLILICILLVSIGLVAVPVSADEGNGTEVVDMRTKYSKTYYLGESGGNPRYRYEASVVPIHYKDNPDNQYETWKEIDTEIVSSANPDWDWEVQKGAWKLYIKSDTTVAVMNEGNLIGFKYAGLAYFDWSTKNFQVVQDKRDVVPIVEDNKIVWRDLFGSGIDLEYVYTPTTFKENIVISESARTWFDNNPPSKFGLNDNSSYFGGYLTMDLSMAYAAEDEYGASIDWDSEQEIINKKVFWKHPLKDEIVTMLPLDYAYSTEDEGNRVPIRHRFYKQNGVNYLLFGAKIKELDTLSGGDIVIDPTLNFQIEAGNRDGYENEDTGAMDIADNEVDLWGSTNVVNRRWGAFYFAGTLPPQGSTINSAYLSLYFYSTPQDTIKGDIYFEDQASPSVLSTGSANITSRVTTSNSTPWEYEDYGVSWHDSPDLSSALQEVVTAYETTALVAIFSPATDEDTQYATVRSYEHTGNLHGAKLYIGYTAPVLAPTVSTDTATNVLATTATINGEITATGGENADYRGFVWDTVSRLDPSNTAPASTDYAHYYSYSGSFGAETFSHDLSSLHSGTTYYVRAYAHNSEGWEYGDEQSFNTLSVAPCSVATVGDSNVEETTATVTGNITDTNGNNATARGFQWDTDSGSPYTDNWSEAGSFGTGTYIRNLTSLTKGELYYFRAFATNAGGNGYGDEDTFLTKPDPPTNFEATANGSTAMDLSWTKGSGALNTYILGKAGSYPVDRSDSSAYLVYNDTGTSVTDTGLSVGTNYYYKAWSYATEGGLEQYSDSAATSIAFLSVATGSATNVLGTSATLNGVLEGMGNYSSVSVYFEYGTTASYGKTTTYQTMTSTGGFDADIESLLINTMYHFRAVASSGGTTVYGSDATFTTKAAGGGTGLPEGAETPVIREVGVFNDYQETGDLLFTAEILVTYPPYYPSKPPFHYFQLQLLDTDNTTILGASPVMQWGDRPASVYFGSSSAASLTNQAAYIFKIANISSEDITDNVTQALTAADWRGNNLIELDAWCIGVAWNMQAHDQNFTTDPYVDYITDVGHVLTQTSGAYFTTGIPNIAQIRPNLFLTAEHMSTIPTLSGDVNYNTGVSLTDRVGTTIVTDANTVGNVFSISGQQFLFYLILSVVAGCIIYTVSSTRGFGALGAMVLALPIVAASSYFEIMNIILPVTVIIILVVLFVRQMVWKTL